MNAEKQERKTGMIYVRFSGGLGNQLFQYAYSRYLQILAKDQVTYLTYLYDEDQLRDFALNKFKIDSGWVENTKYDFWSNHRKKRMVYVFFKIQIELYKRIHGGKLSKRWIERIQNRNFKQGLYVDEPEFYFAPEVYGLEEKYVKGFWHHPMYAEKIKGILESEIILGNPKEIPSQYYDRIREADSVCVHIRRGDYTNYTYYIVCGVEYYRCAIEKMREVHPGCVFFVFSDDIEWCKREMGVSSDLVYIDDIHKDYIDFCLMKSCNHFIISNSTFSWWAAYLGNYHDKTVMTPDKWYSDGRNKPQLNLEGWIVIETGA